MSTDALAGTQHSGHAHQVLRIALAGALGIALPTALGIPMGFIGAVVAVNAAATMRALPPLKQLLGLIAIVFLVPAVFNRISGAFLEYPYLLIGFIWLVLFHGYRLQLTPKTKLFGVLAVSFAIIVPVVTGAAEVIGPLFVQVLGLNFTAAVVALVIAFAAFPPDQGGQPAGAAAHAPADTASREEQAARARSGTVLAAMNATVMAVLMAWCLAYDAVTSLRILFVASSVLAASDPREVGRQSYFAFAAVIIAGLAAILVSFIWIVLPSPLVGLLLGILATLTLGHRALDGPNAPAYVNGLASMWVLLSTNGTDPASQVVTWSLYAMAGAGFAAGARAMLVRLFGTGPQTA